jgi:ribose-phosphate pyrophosphokinase
MKFIDSDDYKAAGIETLFFPGGEPHAKVPEFDGIVVLYLKLRTWNDVGLAACVLDALSLSRSIRQVHVGLMYFPGARQDKTDGGKYPLTVHIVSKLLCRDRRFVYYVFDAHSDVLKAHLSGYVPLDFTNLNISTKEDVVGIIAPDAGAFIRAGRFKDWFYPEVPVITCAKKRDPVTGTLSGYAMPPLSTKGRYIIVDDICDGGGTFNLLTGEFWKDRIGSCSSLELFVSHGIFSKGIGNIDAKIEHITTTDSWCPGIGPSATTLWNDGVMKGRLTVLPLADLLKQAVKLRIG